jgi:hypothetical protein
MLDTGAALVAIGQIMIFMLMPTIVDNWSRDVTTSERPPGGFTRWAAPTVS